MKKVLILLICSFFACSEPVVNQVEPVTPIGEWSDINGEFVVKIDSVNYYWETKKSTIKGLVNYSNEDIVFIDYGRENWDLLGYKIHNDTMTMFNRDLPLVFGQESENNLTVVKKGSD